LVKTQLELAAEGKRTLFLFFRQTEVEALFRSYLEKEFSKTVSIRLAASIMLHIFGNARVYGYQQASADRMREGLREGMPWLPWE
jgi:TetR/AcrR family transcriptional repressor of nem operon